MAFEKMREFTNDGAWCFFADPRALYFKGVHERVYAGWLNSVGDVMLGQYDYALEQMHTVTIRHALQQDDHANPTLYIDDCGCITIFYSAHNGSTMYFRRTEKPEDIQSFGDEQSLPTNTEGQHGYTYPNPIYLADEQKLYLFWRGGNFKPNFSVTTDLPGNKWSSVHTLIQDSGQRPYIRYAGNGKNTIHFSCTDGHPNVEPHNSIYYARYLDGGLYRADGSFIKSVNDLPLQRSDMDVVFDGAAAGRNAWIWDIATDEDNYPVIVYVVFESVQDHRYYYSRWNGEQWVTNEMTAGGGWFPQTAQGAVEREPYYSGGIILDHADPSVVYVSREVNGVFEIERWQTKDLGLNWQSEAVTSDSSSNQVRPYLTRGNHDQPTLLFWMSGEYVHFTQYQTSLYAAFLPE